MSGNIDTNGRVIIFWASHKTLWLLALVAIMLASCSQALDSRQIEAAIQQEIEGRGGIPVKSVNCPGKVAIAVGESFQCQGELAPTGEFTATVEQQDEYGNVTLDIPNSRGLLNLTKLETVFQAQLGSETESQPVVNCGGVYRANQPGDSFECKVLNAVTKSQTRIEAILVKVDPQGNVNWQQVRRQLVATSPVVEATPISGVAIGTPQQEAVNGVPPVTGEAIAPTTGGIPSARPALPNSLD